MDEETKNQIIEEGRVGEDLFRKSCQQDNLPFLYVEQDFENFSLLFKNNVKRPDFLVLVQGMGFLAVDVKHLAPRPCDGFSLSFENELQYSMDFEQSFKIYLWYAIRDKSNPDDDNWYFISAYDALDKGEVHIRHDNEQKYFIIDRKHFTIMRDLSDIGKLLSKSIGFSGLIGRALEDKFRTSKIPG